MNAPQAAGLNLELNFHLYGAHFLKVEAGMQAYKSTFDKQLLLANTHHDEASYEAEMCEVLFDFKIKVAGAQAWAPILTELINDVCA